MGRPETNGPVSQQQQQSAHRFSGEEGMVEQIMSRMDRLENAMVSVAESMQTLVRVEVSHNETRSMLTRAIEDVRGLDARMRTAEVLLPGLSEVRRWVIAGVATGLTMMIGSVFALVLKLPPH